MLGGSLGYTDGKVLGYDEVIKLVSTDGKVFGTILVNVDKITPWLDIGIELGFFDELFDGYNDGKLEVLFIGDSLGYIYGKVLGSDEGINLGSTDGKKFILVSNMQIPLPPVTE